MKTTSKKKTKIKSLEGIKNLKKEYYFDERKHPDQLKNIENLSGNNTKKTTNIPIKGMTKQNNDFNTNIFNWQTAHCTKSTNKSLWNKQQIRSIADGIWEWYLKIKSTNTTFAKSMMSYEKSVFK